MRNLITILFAACLLSCSRLTPEQELSSFLSTRAEEPLAGTVWEHRTTDDFNRYLYFSEADVSLFYGLVEDGELQRWSPFYTSPYALEDGVVTTSLSYPLWGHTEYTESATLIKGDGFTIDLSGDLYEYYGPYTESIEGQWMWLYAGITPWEKPKE